MNEWSFSGTIQSVERRTTAKGKLFQNLVISQTDGNYKRLCVCTHWGDEPEGCVEGASVTASGRIAGREWNGKCYAGLDAVRVQVTTAAPDNREPEQPPAPADDTGLPF